MELGVSHHAAPHRSAAQGIVLSEAGATELQGEDVWDGGLTDQGVKERFQCLVRLERDQEHRKDPPPPNTQYITHEA